MTIISFKIQNLIQLNLNHFGNFEVASDTAGREDKFPGTKSATGSAIKHQISPNCRNLEPIHWKVLGLFFFFWTAGLS